MVTKKKASQNKTNQTQTHTHTHKSEREKLETEKGTEGLPSMVIDTRRRIREKRWDRGRETWEHRQ